MKTYQLHTHFKQILADTITPVSIYLKIRDTFPNSILLESSDYHTADNSFSYVCCNPIASIKIENNTLVKNYPDNTSQEIIISNTTNIPAEIEAFAAQFQPFKNDFARHRLQIK